MASTPTDGSFAPTDLAWPAIAAEVGEFRRRARTALADILGEAPFEEPPPLAPRTIYTSDDGGWWRHKVAYGMPTDDVVFAWLLVPKKTEGPAPAVICLPGSFMTPNWGKDGPAGLAGPANPGDPEAYGRDAVRLGYVTLCPDYPCAGERTTPGLKSHDTTELDRRFPTWTRVGRSAWDVSRAVDFLLTRPEVDGGRIACMGWSQGGQMSLIGAALDQRIAVAVSVCGWGPLRGVGGDRAVNWVQSYNFPRLRPHFDSGLPLPVDFDQVVGLLAPRPFLDVRAREDQTFSNRAAAEEGLQRIAALYELVGAADSFRSAWVPGSHGYGSAAARESQAWLYRWLWA
ncbi:dienelactone hydrolase family protein [Candidatus Latescibacterota bacterium]